MGMMGKWGRPAASASMLLAAACVPRVETPPARPAPVQPQPAPSPAPTPPPPPAAVPDWSDIPLTPGTWSYRSDAAGSEARFGMAGSEVRLSLRCDRAQRRVILSREGSATGGWLEIRTSFGARNVPATVRADPLPHSRATFAASDSFLDSIVFSRGRFTVDAPELPILVVPTWPETARVVEDCRG
ncbi:hypothetical protein [Sphingosinicella rhizophila]|uniref:Lipoprotein n=1 Tax=Sphingosinicella rhizophila TaxID=3050082 RepID=A0ABU3QC93_9SPHN|nr:hypothetical protein [Sphingosinicella sp. GR2756]MDT9600998.1 hypothetical protein [Sphingosinicella sp. GR2756]